MDRRSFMQFGVAALAAAVFSVAGGCSRSDGVATPGNQEKLWRMTAQSEEFNEPIDLAYAKNTPVFYRDASFGKEDPNFKPKTGGG